PSWLAEIQASDPKILESKIGPNEIRLYTNPAGEHRDFLDCIKTRKDPYFPVDIGHRVSTICHLGNIALKLGRKLNWDPKEEKFVNDAEADAMLSRPMRSPWKLA
ncbi:MAG: gfo/Idh/MocA family oxidoreductase, partial [Phycisphaerae bacterium]|nr:gfo/Idh/MocA family oxidoreductase [Phycisphaerae bacterium]